MAAGDIPGPYQPISQPPFFTGTEGVRYDGVFSNLTDARQFAYDVLGGRVSPMLGEGWTNMNIIRSSDGKGWYVETQFTRPSSADTYDPVADAEREGEIYPPGGAPPRVPEPPPGQPPAPPGEPAPPAAPTGPMNLADLVVGVAGVLAAADGRSDVQRQGQRRRWSAAELDLSSLHDVDVATGLERLADGWWTVEPRRGWSELARQCSTLNPGQWLPRQTGMVFLCGSHRAWFTPRFLVPSVCRSLDVVARLGLKAGYSIGSCARSLVRSIGVPQHEDRSVEALFDDAAFGYHDCLPGTYEDGVLYDMRRAYFTLWQRLPSLRLTLGSDGRLIWLGLTRGEELQRRRVEAEVVGEKVLRNAIYGVSLGGVHRLAYWRAGELCRGPILRGPFRPAGLLIARLAWELTRAASEEVSSVYSHTDSVLAVGGAWPSVWDGYGLAVDVRAEGPATVLQRGVYEVGSYATVWYRLGEREPVLVARADRPRHGYAEDVLAA